MTNSTAHTVMWPIYEQLDAALIDIGNALLEHATADYMNAVESLAELAASVRRAFASGIVVIDGHTVEMDHDHYLDSDDPDTFRFMVSTGTSYPTVWLSTAHLEPRDLIEVHFDLDEARQVAQTDPAAGGRRLVELVVRNAGRHLEALFAVKARLAGTEG